MRTRRSNNAYAVTLFPFLAVLICTMGVLVALLVVAVHAAGQSVKKESAEIQDKQAAKLKELEYAIEENEFRVEGLADFRPDVVERLKVEREKRSHLQASLKAIDDEALQLANQLKQLEQQPHQSSETLAELEATEETLKRQILAVNEQLENLEKQKPVEQVVYSVVPTDAMGGTNRRPIYIECVGNRLILQPHGITFDVRDFVRPIEAGNPLDAAMIAIRNYWDKHQLSGKEGDAYPLLIVRPSGAKSYALARHAIQSWDDEFGYELITEDLKLEFGVRDLQLEQEIQITVAEAKRRQQRMTAIALAEGNQLGGNGGLTRESRYTGLTVDHANGGFTQQGQGSGQAGATAQDWRSQSEGGGRETAANPSRPTRNHPSEGATHLAAKGATHLESGAAGTAGGSKFGNTLESVASRKGEDWALPSRTQGGTIYRRPITITCSGNRLVIESGTSLDDRPKIVQMNGATSEAVDPLVEEVWQKIDSWGFAGAGGYWKPELRIRVTQDGVQRARELAVLLDGSGLDLVFSESR